MLDYFGPSSHSVFVDCKILDASFCSLITLRNIFECLALSAMLPKLLVLSYLCFNPYSNTMRQRLSCLFSILKETEPQGGKKLAQMSGRAGSLIQVMWLQTLFLAMSQYLLPPHLFIDSLSSTTRNPFCVHPICILAFGLPSPAVFHIQRSESPLFLQVLGGFAIP